MTYEEEIVESALQVVHERLEDLSPLLGPYKCNYCGSTYHPNNSVECPIFLAKLKEASDKVDMKELERLGKETAHNDALFSQKESTETPKYKVWVEYRDTLVRIGEVYVDPNGTNNRQLEVLLAGIIDKVRELESKVGNLEISVGGIRN